LKNKNGYKFLIIQQIFGDWIFPKGHSIGKETEVQTVLRELYEETNIKNCKIIESFREIIKYTVDKNDGNIEKRVSYFMGEVSVNEAKKISVKNSGNEVINIDWFSYEEALKKLSHENHRILLLKVLNYLEEKYK